MIIMNEANAILNPMTLSSEAILYFFSTWKKFFKGVMIGKRL